MKDSKQSTSDGKKDKKSKSTITKAVKDDGLKVLHHKEFGRSLKFTWIRKILNQSPEWEEFPQNYKIDSLIHKNGI